MSIKKKETLFLLLMHGLFPIYSALPSGRTLVQEIEEGENNFPQEKLSVPMTFDEKGCISRKEYKATLLNYFKANTTIAESVLNRLSIYRDAKGQQEIFVLEDLLYKDKTYFIGFTYHLGIYASDIKGGEVVAKVILHSDERIESLQGWKDLKKEKVGGERYNFKRLFYISKKNVFKVLSPDAFTEENLSLQHRIILYYTPLQFYLKDTSTRQEVAGELESVPELTPHSISEAILGSSEIRAPKGQKMFFETKSYGKENPDFFRGSMPMKHLGNKENPLPYHLGYCLLEIFDHTHEKPTSKQILLQEEIGFGKMIQLIQKNISPQEDYAIVVEQTNDQYHYLTPQVFETIKEQEYLPIHIETLSEALKKTEKDSFYVYEKKEKNGASMVGTKFLLKEIEGGKELGLGHKEARFEFYVPVDQNSKIRQKNFEERVKTFLKWKDKNLIQKTNGVRYLRMDEEKLNRLAIYHDKEGQKWLWNPEEMISVRTYYLGFSYFLCLMINDNHKGFDIGSILHSHEQPKKFEDWQELIKKNGFKKEQLFLKVSVGKNGNSYRYVSFDKKAYSEHELLSRNYIPLYMAPLVHLKAEGNIPVNLQLESLLENMYADDVSDGITSTQELKTSKGEKFYFRTPAYQKEHPDFFHGRRRLPYGLSKKKSDMLYDTYTLFELGSESQPLLYDLAQWLLIVHDHTSQKKKKKSLLIHDLCYQAIIKAIHDAAKPCKDYVIVTKVKDSEKAMPYWKDFNPETLAIFKKQCPYSLQVHLMQIGKVELKSKKSPYMHAQEDGERLHKVKIILVKCDAGVRYFQEKSFLAKDNPDHLKRRIGKHGVSGGRVYTKEGANPNLCTLLKKSDQLTTQKQLYYGKVWKCTLRYYSWGRSKKVELATDNPNLTLIDLLQQSEYKDDLDWNESFFCRKNGKKIENPEQRQISTLGSDPQLYVKSYTPYILGSLVLLFIFLTVHIVSLLKKRKRKASPPKRECQKKKRRKKCLKNSFAQFNLAIGNTKGIYKIGG